MENVFIDTDVIVDFLTNRKPFSLESAKIFSLIDQKKIRGCVSASHSATSIMFSGNLDPPKK